MTHYDRCRITAAQTIMSSDNPFISPLGKLALSLGASPSSSGATAAAATSTKVRQNCINTLLRVIDNILDDPNQLNPKLRKIKVKNPTFWKRCGCFEGSIDFLVTCGFVVHGDDDALSTTRYLKLEKDKDDDRDLLLYGREMLAQFAVLTLGIDEVMLPNRCPTTLKSEVDQSTSEGANVNVKKAPITSSGMGSETSQRDNNIISTLPVAAEQNGSLEENHDDETHTNAACHQEEQPLDTNNDTDSKDANLTIATIATNIVELSTTTTEDMTSSSSALIIDHHEQTTQFQQTTQIEEEASITQSKDNIITSDQQQQQQQHDLISDEMTNLLNEIEAELDDDFFSTDQEDVILMSEANNKDDVVTEKAEVAEASTADIISVTTSNVINNIEEEEEVNNTENGEISLPNNSKEITSMSNQSNDLELPSMVEDLLELSETDKTFPNDISPATRQDNDNCNIKETEVPSIDTANKENALSNEEEDIDLCTSSSNDAEHHLTEQKMQLNGIELDVKSVEDTSQEVSEMISNCSNNRTSLLRTSISSEKTLQIRNTLGSPQDSHNHEVTVKNENEASQGINAAKASIFCKIPIPEGEYASSNDEDAEKFRFGFELCFQSLLSIWPSSGMNSVSGLSNLERCSKDEVSTKECDPVILVPPHLVYAIWTYVLGLHTSATSKSKSTDYNNRAQFGSLYTWIVSNNKRLSALDEIPIRNFLSTMNIHTNLSESNVSVCNYVLKSLKEMRVIDVYGGNIIVDSTPSINKSFFIGIDGRVCEEYANKDSKFSNILPEDVIRECHHVLAGIIHPLLVQLDNEGNPSNNNTDQILSWYALRHAPRHLMTINQLSDAKSLLLNDNFIRARIQCMGNEKGTKQHCQDCNELANCLTKSECDWKRTQLHAADTKQKQSPVVSLEDYGTQDQFHEDPASIEWKESRVKALCAVSIILREKIGHILDPNALDEKVEIGNSLQMVGESIGNVGIYTVEELEHYDEALQLKSEALGDKHTEVADTLYAMGCHHQRFQRFTFSQKCYEQALGIYKAQLGYDDPRVSRVLHNIGVMYHAKNESDVAMKCFQKSLSIRRATLGDDDISLAESYCWIGNINREREEFDAARESFVTAHRIKALVLGKDHPECAEILHNIGVVCDDLGLYSESLTSFREALAIRRAHVASAYDANEMKDICDTLNCIGNVYRAKMDRKRALHFFEESIKRRAKIVSTSLSDNSQVSILLSTYEDVIALLKVELKDSTDKGMIPVKIGSILIEMGVLYNHRLNKPSKGLAYFQRALQVYKQMKDFKKIGVVLSHMAHIHLKKADSQKALKCFRDALVLQKKSLEGDSLEIADTLHNIGNCEREGDVENSVNTYLESLQIKKTLLPAEHVSTAMTEHCIGLAQLQIGKLDKSLDYFHSSLKSRQSLLGNDHLDVSFSLHNIGRIYFYQDKFEEAIRYVGQALKIKEASLHERHTSLAESQHLMGSLLIKRDDFSSAIPLLRSALITYKSKKDCEVLKSDVLDLLAKAYMSKGDNQSAILSLEQSLRIKREILGPDDLACANVLMIVGKLKQKMENINGALVAFKEVKRIQKRVYGKDHLKNAELLVEVAAIQNELGNGEVALRCYTEALRIRRVQLYINNPEIAEVLVNLGKIHQANGNHANAVECLEEAVDIYTKKQSSSELAAVYYLLGMSQLATDEIENGSNTLEKCLKLRESVYGNNSEEWAEVAYDVAVSKLETDAKNDGVLLLEEFVRITRRSTKDNLDRLSNALVELGKIYEQRSMDEALEHYDEALEMQKSAEGNELWMSDVLFRKGNILETRKQYPQSLAMYEESLQLRKSVAGEDEVTADIMKRVGEIHRLRGSYDQAQEHFESALDVYRMTVGNTHESVADTLHCLGYIQDSKNDIDKALSYHREALNVRKLILGKDHVKIASSLDDIARIYQNLGDNVKAIRCLKEALRVRKLTLGDEDMEVASTLFGLGICCAAINETPKAMECYNRALEISSFDGCNPKLEAQALHQIGCVHASRCSYREALQSWRTSLSKYREAGLADDHYMVACTLGNIEMAENVLSSGEH